MKHHRHDCVKYPVRAALAFAIAALFSAFTTLPARAQHGDEVRTESDDGGWRGQLAWAWRGWTRAGCPRPR